MKKIATLIITICALFALTIPADAFTPYYAVQWGTYISAYEEKDGHICDEFNRTEIFDEASKKLTIDKREDNRIHIKDYGWIPPSDNDKLMYVSKLSKRYVASGHANLYDYYGNPIVLDRGDVVYLTGAKRGGRVGVMHVDEEGYKMYGWMSSSRLGVKKKLKKTSHYYKTASDKYPIGSLKKGKVVYIIKTSGKFSYAYNYGYVKTLNLIS